MKHIEQIQPELAAFELDRIVREEGDATATAALSRLLHNMTGCDIPQTSALPESEVEELVPLCVSILRRHWQTPLTCLGDGITPMSLADLLQQLIDGRVNGNEALGIPPANANIPTALTALRERKIDAGFASCPDGISLVQVLCGTLASQVTEIVDSNRGWTMDISKIKALAAFPIKTIKLNGVAQELRNGAITAFNSLENLHLPYVYKLRRGNSQQAAIVNCQNLKVVDMSSVDEVFADGAPDYPCIHNCPSLQKVILGTITVRFSNLLWEASSANLVHLELGKDTCVSISLNRWSPSAETLALPEFLSNFKTYIAHRLTDKGSGLTLTLSPAVRDAIQTDPEIVSIITSKGWTISPAPSV